MTQPGPPRDWDKELAEIDRLIAKQPAQPPAPAPRGQPAPNRPASGPPRAAGRTLLGGWLRVLLGVAVAAAMTRWPYAARCGWPLYLYLAATGAVLLAGIWGMVVSWQRRMPLAHVVALGVALWGFLLAGRVILDRTGYAKQSKAWVCGAQPTADSR